MGISAAMRRGRVESGNGIIHVVSGGPQRPLILLLKFDLLLLGSGRRLVSHCALRPAVNYVFLARSHVTCDIGDYLVAIGANDGLAAEPEQLLLEALPVLPVVGVGGVLSRLAHVVAVLELQGRAEELLCDDELQVEDLVLVVPGEDLGVLSVQVLVQRADEHRVLHDLLGLLRLDPRSLDLGSRIITQLAYQVNDKTLLCLLLVLLGLEHLIEEVKGNQVFIGH